MHSHSHLKLNANENARCIQVKKLKGNKLNPLKIQNHMTQAN